MFNITKMFASYMHIKRWTSSFTVKIGCFMSDVFFDRGSSTGDIFKCEGCNIELDFRAIPNLHTLEKGEMKE